LLITTAQNQIAFIFDMDGTIIDSMPFHILSWLRLFAELGIHITADEIRRNNRGTIGEVLRRIMGSHLSDAKVAALGGQKEALFRELYRPHLALIAGLEPFLDEAKRLGIPMALATSAGRDNIAFVLDGLAIRSYFDAVVGGDDVEKGKPDPEVLLTAAAMLKMPPERCVVFEDSLSGIEAAHRAGMTVVAITTTLDAQDLRGLSSVVAHVIEDYRSLQFAGMGARSALKS
jgi:beta-phosphoglucomutase